MTAKSFIFHAFLVLMLSFSLMPTADAAKVKSVKGRRVIVDTQGDRVKAGDYFYVMSGSGKKKGIVKIRKVKGRSALGLLGRGKATKGDDLVARNRSSRKKGQTMARTGTPDSGGPTGSYWGILVGTSSNTADIDIVDGSGNFVEKITADGSGFSAKAFFDYPLLPWLWFRGMSGIEQFNVEGKSLIDCANSKCNAEITYITADFWGRVPLFGDKTKFWVGAGFNLLFPMSKEAGALDEGSITNTSIIGAGAGIDIFMSNSTFIPLSFEYGLYPSSDQVDASAIFLRAGYGMSW